MHSAWVEEKQELKKGRTWTEHTGPHWAWSGFYVQICDQLVVKTKQKMSSEVKWTRADRLHTRLHVSEGQAPSSHPSYHRQPPSWSLLLFGFTSLAPNYPVPFDHCLIHSSFPLSESWERLFDCPSWLQSSCLGQSFLYKAMWYFVSQLINCCLVAFRSHNHP